ncbi:hypothetical protein ACLOJK_019966 [Asimina triloba]
MRRLHLPCLRRRAASRLRRGMTPATSSDRWRAKHPFSHGEVAVKIDVHGERSTTSRSAPPWPNPAATDGDRQLWTVVIHGEQRTTIQPIIDSSYELQVIDERPVAADAGDRRVGGATRHSSSGVGERVALASKWTAAEREEDELASSSHYGPGGPSGLRRVGQAKYSN